MSTALAETGVKQSRDRKGVVTSNDRRKESVDGADHRQASQVVSFRLANEEYGLDIMQVRGIILMGAMTENNASAAEEMSGSSEELAGQAGQLKELVS